MRFGKSQAEAAEEPGRGGGGGDFIRYLKDDPVTMRILQDPSDWTYFWEHFSPQGFNFPCPRDADDPVEMCPGCSSENEKMKKVSRKIAFNMLHSVNGQEYVDTFKVGPMIADKLENRYKRFGTVTDRDYTLSRYKTSGDRWDFEVEASQPSPVDVSKYELRNIEELLQASWDEAWGDSDQARANQLATQTAEKPEPRRAGLTIAPAPQPQSEEPPFEEKVVREEDLRAMDHAELLVLIKAEMGLIPPSSLTTSDGVVDWMMEIQA